MPEAFTGTVVVCKDAAPVCGGRLVVSGRAGDCRAAPYGAHGRVVRVQKFASGRDRGACLQRGPDSKGVPESSGRQGYVVLVVAEGRTAKECRRVCGSV